MTVQGTSLRPTNGSLMCTDGQAAPGFVVTGYAGAYMDGIWRLGGDAVAPGLVFGFVMIGLVGGHPASGA